MVGSLFTGPICDRFGRRAGMITGSILIMTGAIVQTAARSDAYLLGGRFTLGFGVSIGTSSAPTYALELAPPQWRARVVGYYNTCKSRIINIAIVIHILMAFSLLRWLYSRHRCCLRIQQEPDRARVPPTSWTSAVPSSDHYYRRTYGSRVASLVDYVG